MGDYKQSPVLSVRMTPELLEALRERAREDGRTVSGEVVYLVQDQLAARRAAAKPMPITGWLREASVADSLAELRTGREAASEQLERAVEKKARRR
jgi:hypothetical protein